MHPKFLFLAQLAILAVATPGQAQNVSEVPPPKPPLVAPVPNYADWTVSIKSAPQAPAGPGKHNASQISEVHTTRTGDTRRDEIAYSNGLKTVSFFVGTLMIWKDGSGSVGIHDMREYEEPLSPDDPTPSVAEGFPGTRWLQLSFYEKVIVLQSRPCYHYMHGESETWIDAESKLPVAYKAEKTGYTFKFNDPPKEAIALPPEYQKALQQYQDGARRRRLMEQPQTPSP